MNRRQPGEIQFVQRNNYGMRNAQKLTADELSQILVDRRILDLVEREAKAAGVKSSSSSATQLWREECEETDRRRVVTNPCGPLHLRPGRARSEGRRGEIQFIQRHTTMA